VRLGKKPARPKTRINTTGRDAYWLLEYLRRHRPELEHGPPAQALRQIVVQNYYQSYYVDAEGRCAGAHPRMAVCRPRPARAGADVRHVQKLERWTASTWHSRLTG
jgi:hypothetical protein